MLDKITVKSFTETSSLHKSTPFYLGSNGGSFGKEREERRWHYNIIDTNDVSWAMGFGGRSKPYTHKELHRNQTLLVDVEIREENPKRIREVLTPKEFDRRLALFIARREDCVKTDLLDIERMNKLK